MNNRRNNRTTAARGFTLVEVLVALAILGGGMFVLVNAHFSALQLHAITADEVDSRMLLESAVAHAEMAISDEETSGGGDFGLRYPDYRWSFESEPLASSESPVLMDTEFFRVTATLHRPDGEDQRLEFITFRNAEMQTMTVGP